MGAAAVKPVAARWRQTWVVFAAGLMLAGLSSFSHTLMFNDSGVRLMVESPRRPLFGRTLIRPGRGREIYTPTALVLSAGNCTYRYAHMPFVGRDYWVYPYGGAEVRMQVGPDFRVWLLPEKASAIMRGPDLLAAQRYGFPVSPTSKACG